MVGYCPLEEHDGVWLPHTRTTTSHEPVRPNFMEELGEHLKHHRDPSFGAKLLGHLWKLLQRHAWLLKERSPGLCIRPGCLRSARASVQPAKASGHEVRAMATCSESCAKGVIDASWCVTCSGRPMPHTDLEWIDLWLRTRYVVPMRPFSVGFPPGVEIRRKRPNPGPTRVANSDGVQAGGSRWARLSLVQQLFRLLSPLNMFRTYLAALWWGLGLLIAFVLSLWAAVMRRALKRILGHGR